MAGDRKQVSFTPGAERLLPGGSVPEHLKAPGFLRPETQEGLAILERALAGQAAQASHVPRAVQMTRVAVLGLLGLTILFAALAAFGWQGRAA